MKKHTLENTSFYYGLLTAAGLIAFFFLMRLTGWIHMYELRALNYVFVFSGIFMAIKSFKQHNRNSFAYFNGLGVGVATSAIALFIFSAFVVIYLLIDVNFMNQLKQFEYFGPYLNPFISGVVILFEGTFSGILTSFILMQYYKYSHLKEMERPIP
ncbi:DUF4199 domain-containing protein [Fulvivirga maritima]|uniref:DUF4199 domain-containing protein n=1 Tax=Fulvivirga maritima TaxID=2904247 RepID=UPI001F42686E|nr:DUF4199 domain-containing protein [Fulvivirga maritima]UII28205.1 DUF4199 domain-containing protein [Fulvivirga maritima]